MCESARSKKEDRELPWKKINVLERESCHAQDSGIDGDSHTLVDDDSAEYDSDSVLDCSERDGSGAECDDTITGRDNLTAASTAHYTESTVNNSTSTELEHARANLSAEQQSNAEKEDRINCMSAALEKTVAELSIARSDLIAASAARDSARTELEQAHAYLSAEQQANAEKEDRIDNMSEELTETRDELEIALSDLTREQTDGYNLRRRHRAALQELDSVKEERDSLREESDTAARSARDSYIVQLNNANAPPLAMGRRHSRGGRTGYAAIVWMADSGTKYHHSSCQHLKLSRTPMLYRNNMDRDFCSVCVRSGGVVEEVLWDYSRNVIVQRSN